MFPVCKPCKLFQQTRRLLLTQLKGETNKKGIDDHSDTSPFAFSLCRNKLNFCAATNGPGSQGRSVNEVVILFPDPWLMSVEGKKQHLQKMMMMMTLIVIDKTRLFLECVVNIF